MKNECYNVKASFTLVEMVVSIGIIIVVIVSAVGIYIFSIGPQQKTTATANLQQDGQLILNMIAKDLRTNKIDYPYYGSCGIINPRPDLALINDISSPTTYVRYRRCKIVGSSQENCGDAEADCTLTKCRVESPQVCGDCTDSDFKQITMADVTVTGFKIYIYPTCDPFGANKTLFQTPQASVTLELKSYKEKIGERRIKLQQTIPQRYQEKSLY